MGSLLLLDHLGLRRKLLWKSCRTVDQRNHHMYWSHIHWTSSPLSHPLCITVARTRHREIGDTVTWSKRSTLMISCSPVTEANERKQQHHHQTLATKTSRAGHELETSNPDQWRNVGGTDDGVLRSDRPSFCATGHGQTATQIRLVYVPWTDAVSLSLEYLTGLDLQQVRLT